MEAKLKLIQQGRADSVGVSEREIPKIVVRGNRETGRGRATQIGNMKRGNLVAICKEEPAGELAIASVKEVDVDDELIFVEPRRLAQTRETPSRERLCRIDRLRSRNQKTAARQLEIQ